VVFSIFPALRRKLSMEHGVSESQVICSCETSAKPSGYLPRLEANPSALIGETSCPYTSQTRSKFVYRLLEGRAKYAGSGTTTSSSTLTTTVVSPFNVGRGPRPGSLIS
jgi:hypothetical protein